MTATPRNLPLRQHLAVITVLLATASASLMQTFLTVSLPTVMVDLNGVPWYSWVSSTYLVAATVTIPPWARLADRTGARLVHVAGMSIWGVSTWAASLADTVPWLLTARVGQGIGAAAVAPAGFAALVSLYPQRYGPLIGLIGATQASTVLAGAPLGGWLAASLGWRSALHLVGSLAVPTVMLGWLSLPQKSCGPADHLPAGQLLRSPSARTAITHTLLLAVIGFGVATFLPLLLQTQFQTRQITAAALATPTLVGVAIGSAIGGLLAEKRDTTRTAWIVVVCGLLLTATPHIAGPVVGSALAAIGVGLGLPAQLVRLERVTTAQHAATAGGMIQASRNIGGAFGVITLGIPLQTGVTPVVGARAAYAALLVISCFALLFGWLTPVQPATSAITDEDQV